MSNLDAATIKELAAQLAENVGQPIDPTALGADLEGCATRYLFARLCEGHRSPMSKSRDFLGKVLRRTKSLRAALEEMTAIEHRYVTFIMADAYKGLPDIKEEVVERQKAQEPDELGEIDPVTPYDVFAYEVLGLIRDLQKIERRLNVAFKHVDEVTRRQRRPPEVCLPMLVNDLASVYQSHTRRRPTTIYRENTRERGGPFVKFVETVIAALEPGKKRVALADTVKNVLRERKRAQSGDDPPSLT